ncbi:MAG TPA: hypothetical protein VMU05_18385 [Dongiaceae bacterium]|nr:hypothetical protein [Dongiaceae bacterium]
MTSRVLGMLLVAYSTMSGLQATDIDYEVDGQRARISTEDLARHVFAAEEKTVARFAKQNPVVETYLQSLNPDVAPESVIDDAYFLRRVSLDVDGSRTKYKDRPAFGYNLSELTIEWNTGARYPLIPQGYVSQLFIDLEVFDENWYDLKYYGQEAVDGINCLKIRVTPQNPKLQGMFNGIIWVEPKHFYIVHTKGKFTPRRLSWFLKYFNLWGISWVGLYFETETRRVEVSPGIWLPVWASIDEKVKWQQRNQHIYEERNLCTSYHFSGTTWVWDYQLSGDTDKSIVRPESPMGALQSAGLIASPGPEQERLDAIAEKIRSAGTANRKVHCRILLTTPPELFHLGDNVIISRGLLNMVPNDTVLGVLLAREIARMKGPEAEPKWRPRPIFAKHLRYGDDFPGFRLPRNVKDSQVEQSENQLLEATGLSEGIASANVFLSSLSAHYGQMSHLLRGRFSNGLLETYRQRSSLSQSTLPIVIRSVYGIDPATNSLLVSLPQSATATPEATAGSAPSSTESSNLTYAPPANQVNPLNTP